MDLIGLFVRDFSPLVATLWLMCAAVCSLALPFMAVSVVLNIARMRRALERIADANEAPRTTGGSGVLGI